LSILHLTASNVFGLAASPSVIWALRHSHAVAIAILEYSHRMARRTRKTVMKRTEVVYILCVCCVALMYSLYTHDTIMSSNDTEEPGTTVLEGDVCFLRGDEPAVVDDRGPYEPRVCHYTSPTVSMLLRCIRVYRCSNKCNLLCSGI
jgi:hypothetical protein